MTAAVFGRGLTVVAAGLLMIGLGCASRTSPRPVEPVRVSQIDAAADPVRRASLRLTLDGLDADARGRSTRARSQYERAIQIDPTNPWAYLALARLEVARGDANRALEYLQQAESLLRAERAFSPGVQPHLFGLRGAALQATGRDGLPELERAAQLAPAVWGDGQLSPSELR